MDDLAVWPATTRILDLAAAGRDDRTVHEMVAAFDTRAAAVTLVVSTAQAIAERLQHAPLAIRIQTPAEATAYMLIRTAHEEPAEPLADLVQDLTRTQLDELALGLLDIWAKAARQDADRGLRGRHTGEIPVVRVPRAAPHGPEHALDARVSGQEGENTQPDAPQPVRALDGRRAP